MTKKIFKSSILVAAAVLIFGIACVMAILYQHFGKQINTELKKEATYLVYGVEENGIDYLKQKVDEYCQWIGIYDIDGDGESTAYNDDGRPYEWCFDCMNLLYAGEDSDKNIMNRVDSV